jgi:uncharacterized protein DUF4386
MTGIRKTALVAGLLYLITFVSSIPALFLLSPVLHHADYIINGGADTRVVWGCLLDLVNALAAIGTAVALFPVVKRQNEGLALGFVMSRMLEGAVVLIGVVSLLAIVSLRQNPSGADPATLLATGRSLVAVRDWTFLLGPGLMPAFNALLLGTLLYRSHLVPRFIPLMGLLGAPLLLVADLATLFGHNTQTSTASFVLTLPVAAWELFLGIYMTVKGFRPSPILPGPVTTPTPDRTLTTIA